MERISLRLSAVCLPNQYPYTLVYRLTPGVEIVAVAHQKRRPDYWKRR